MFEDNQDQIIKNNFLRLSEDSCVMGFFVGYKGDNLRRFLVENFPEEVKDVVNNATTEADVPSLLLKVGLLSFIDFFY